MVGCEWGWAVGLDVSQVSVWDEELGLPWRHSWFPGILIHSVILIKGLGFPEKKRKYFIWCVFVSPQKLLKLLQLLLTSSRLIKTIRQTYSYPQRANIRVVAVV